MTRAERYARRLPEPARLLLAYAIHTKGINPLNARPECVSSAGRTVYHDMTAVRGLERRGLVSEVPSGFGLTEFGRDVGKAVWRLGLVTFAGGVFTAVSLAPSTPEPMK